MPFNRLYLRIWLAVVATVAVLTLLVGWIARMTADPPFRQVIVRDDAGLVIGAGKAWLRRPDGAGGPRRGKDEAQSAALSRAEPDGDASGSPDAAADPAAARLGPEFLVRMHDGKTMHMHLPRPPQNPWSRPPYGFAWMLTLVAVAVALGAYPVVRKLTRRLEQLQGGVEQWGQGDLSARVALSGNDEVGFLAQRFNHAAQRIETLVKSHESVLASQKSLLANASHELRSPLARIRMALELLGPASSAPIRDELSRNISELDLLIDEILLASRLDAKEADLGTVEAMDLVGLAAEECARVGAELTLGSDACASGSRLNTPPGNELVVQGVAKLLRRALRNLLENARRHGAGEIVLSLSRQSGCARIGVCDRGPGVPAELRERIFEPFYRLPGATERDGGVGLGLALVKSIALRHGGTVRCEDHAGGGACFVLELPLNA